MNEGLGGDGETRKRTEEGRGDEEGRETMYWLEDEISSRGSLVGWLAVLP